MSSSLRVLRQPDIGDDLRYGSSGTQRSLDDAVEEAYQRGLDDGRGRAADQMMAAADAVRAALDTEREHLRGEFTRQRQVLVAAAVELAEVVLGHANHDGGDALTARIERMMSSLDDSQITVAVNPIDAEIVYAMGMSGIDVVGDASLKPGEAKVVGDWSSTEFTFKAALAAAQEALQDV